MSGNGGVLTLEVIMPIATSAINYIGRTGQNVLIEMSSCWAKQFVKCLQLFYFATPVWAIEAIDHDDDGQSSESVADREQTKVEFSLKYF